MQFGERLTALRKKKGLTQEQLAEQLSLTRQTISKWELEQSLPDIVYLLELSSFFEVSTDYLLKGEEKAVENVPANPVQNVIRVDLAKEEKKDSFGHWRLIAVGSFVCMLTFFGIVAFVICSVLNPWGVMIDNYIFEGLLGFLIGTDTLWFFVLLVILFICGGVLLGVAVWRELVRKRI